MKKLLLTAAVLAFATGAAQAATSSTSNTNDGAWYSLPPGWYVSAGGGFNFAPDDNFKAHGAKDKVDYDTGWLGEVALGHAWGNNMRTEIEGSYRHNNVDEVKGGGAAGGSGDFHSWNAMLNEYYDFKNRSAWTPYLGVGVGAAFENAHNIGTAFAPRTTINDWDTQFAYQGIAGVDYWTTPRSALGLRYDYFSTTRGKFDTTNAAVIGRARDEQYQNHSILVTYRWQFDDNHSARYSENSEQTSENRAPAAAVAPSQTAQATTYAVPSEQDIENSPYKVFFSNDSSKLNDTGRQTVADAVSAYDNQHMVVINLTSNTDTTGTVKHNDHLSAARAESVRKALIAKGVDPQKINVVSNAERDLPIPTGDGVREARNRVVTIVL